MKITIQKKVKSQSGLILVPIFSNHLKKLPNYPADIKAFIQQRLSKKEFTAKKGEELFSYISSKELPEKLLLIGCGEAAKFDSTKARELGGKIAKSIKKYRAEEISFFMPDELAAFAEEFLQGFLMMQYDIAKFKTTKKKNDKGSINKMDLISEGNAKSLEQAVEKAQLVTHAVDYVKDLVNSPANIVDSEYLASEARRIAKENGYKITVMGNKELAKMKAGGILAVNNGSKNDAKLIVLEYAGGKPTEKPLVLVGKGVVFDTGGYNLKPNGSIETMQQDMAGGGAVLGVFEILKKLKIKKNVIGIIPAVSNMISELAYRPSDIITMLNGKTVEITNTDAEGRIILADALTYAVKLKPQAIISIATLTGAVAVALGDRYCGVMSNNEDLAAKLKTAGDEVDELVWPLPIHDDYRKKMDSSIADYRNYDLGTGRYGGTVKAAAFLEKFVEKTTWGHLDIGGTAFTTDPSEYQTKGATAHGLRIFLRFLEKF